MQKNKIEQILDSFEPISLEEMDAVKLMNRVDTKFVFHMDDLLIMLQELQKDYRVLEVNEHRLSSYESVYFDTADFQLYSDHHRKKVDRFKVRYRKYLDSKLTFLEVKHKFKGRTDKRRIVVDDLRTHLPEEDLKFIYSTGIPELPMNAVLSNTFQRITLVGKEHNERLTIDVNLKFTMDDHEVSLDDVIIAELKQEEASRISPVFSLLKKHHIRPNRISKYCIGLISMLGQDKIKYNRFKKKLLILNKLIHHAA